MKSEDIFFMAWLISMPIVAIGFMVYYNLRKDKIKGYASFLIFGFICTLLFPFVLVALIVGEIIFFTARLITNLIKLFTNN